MNGGKLVTLEQCYDTAHAHILRGLLETNDIPCFMNGEHHNATDPFLAIGLGGVRVMVHEKDLARAQALLSIENEDVPIAKKPFLQKPYLRTIALGIVGLFAGMPLMRAKGKHES